MTTEPPRCAHCNHFHGSHIGEDGCIVEFISGPASGPDTTPSRDDPHPGRVVEVCDCKEFV